ANSGAYGGARAGALTRIDDNGGLVLGGWDQLNDQFGSPLLDTEMIEFAATIPTALRLRGWETKHLLKRLASRFVPPEVLYRRKRGFVMPASRWLRGALSSPVRAALDSDSFHDRGWVRPEFTRRILDDHQRGARDWGAARAHRRPLASSPRVVGVAAASQCGPCVTLVDNLLVVPVARKRPLRVAGCEGCLRRGDARDGGEHRPAPEGAQGPDLVGRGVGPGRHGRGGRALRSLRPGTARGDSGDLARAALGHGGGSPGRAHALARRAGGGRSDHRCVPLGPGAGRGGGGGADERAAAAPDGDPRRFHADPPVRGGRARGQLGRGPGTGEQRSSS
ncbi:MAG: hypothetical protein B7X11_04900, partial [Acidobacteria bacterium 37-65-4]